MTVPSGRAGVTVGRRHSRGLRVLVVGGGVAGLEALLALRALAADAVDLLLLSPGDEFVYRPLEVLEPFYPHAMVRIPWARILDDRHVSHLADALHAVDLNEHVVSTTSGHKLGYDLLVLAPGARVRSALPGALTVGVPGAGRALRELISDLRAGTIRRVAFLVPASVTWTLPIYELVLLAAADALRAGVEPELLVVTAEAEPLEVFGSEASKMIRELLAEHSIGLCTRSAELGADTQVDRLVALPRLEGPRIAGLRADADGFLLVDGHGRVAGEDAVYAAGDATALPVKQGGIAAQQADAVAAHIAVRVGAQVELMPFEPVLRGMLLTGGAPQYLRRSLMTAAGTEISSDAPWWPRAKIVGRHLGPYLATHVEWAGPRP
jgi:sulfide:quinone oxidoreductase